MAKIVIDLEVSSRAHTDEVLELIAVDLRKRALGFIWHSIDNAKFGIGDGPVDRPAFSITGTIQVKD